MKSGAFTIQGEVRQVGKHKSAAGQYQGKEKKNR